MALTPCRPTTNVAARRAVAGRGDRRAAEPLGVRRAPRRGVGGGQDSHRCVKSRPWTTSSCSSPAPPAVAWGSRRRVPGAASWAVRVVAVLRGQPVRAVLENVRAGRNLVQGTAFPANDTYGALFWIDRASGPARRRSPRSSRTSSYAKGDKDEPPVSIRARVSQTPSRLPGRTVVTLDLHAPPACRASSASRWTTSTPRSCATPSPPRGSGTWWWWHLRRRLRRKSLGEANRLQAPTAIADKRRVDHTESAQIVELDRLGRRPQRFDRRRLHHLGRDAGRRGPGAGGARGGVGLRAVTHGLLAGPPA